jgi:hypothetical protein
MKRFFASALAIAVLSVGAVQAQDYNQTDTQHDMSTSTTVTGTVVSSVDNQLVIRTDSGQQMTFSLDQVGLDPGRMNLDAGDRVRIEHRAGTTAGTMVAVNVTELDASGAAVTQDQTTRYQDQTSTSYDDSSTLPATASPLPLIGLVGFLALLGGMGLRAIRHRS